MNRSQLINKVSLRSNCSKKTVASVLKVIVNSIKNSLKQGNKVSLIGFGTFIIRNRLARIIYHPKTGNKIMVPMSKMPGFRAARNFKDSVN